MPPNGSSTTTSEDSLVKSVQAQTPIVLLPSLVLCALSRSPESGVVSHGGLLDLGGLLT
uniref:Uncharacterized protein n=1 Tax=Moniliophthora roreri TaxID=221103 RepID=A0A0W0FPS9_MONRR